MWWSSYLSLLSTGIIGVCYWTILYIALKEKLSGYSWSFFTFTFFFWNRVSLYSPGGSWTCYIAQAGFKLAILRAYLYVCLYSCFNSRDKHVINDESSSSSIIFAEFTSEKEKHVGESDVENQNNKLVNYTTNLVIRNNSEFESSVGLVDSSAGSVVKHQPLLRHNSDLEGNFTSTEESSGENLNSFGQTEVQYFPRIWQCDAYPKSWDKVVTLSGLQYSSADFLWCSCIFAVALLSLPQKSPLDDFESHLYAINHANNSNKELIAISSSIRIFYNTLIEFSQQPSFYKQRNWRVRD